MPSFSFHAKTYYVSQSLRSIRKEKILKAAKKMQNSNLTVLFDDFRFIRIIKLQKKKKEKWFEKYCRFPKEYIKTKTNKHKLNCCSWANKLKNMSSVQRFKPAMK